MAYEPTVWVNDSAPALNAANLNKLEQAVADASELDGEAVGAAELDFGGDVLTVKASIQKAIQDANQATALAAGLEEALPPIIQDLTSRIEALENAAE